MKEILAAFALAAQTIKSRADAALEGMGPVDQFDGAHEVCYALKTLQWAAREVEGMLGNVAALEAKLDPEVAAAAAALLETKLAEKVAAGEYLLKADSDLAIAAAETAAKTLGKQEAEAAFQLKEAAALKLTERRAEVTTAHGAEVAAMISEKVLTVEDFTPVAAELGRRVSALHEIGVTAAAKPLPFGQIACGIPFTDEGKAEFDTRLAAAKELAAPVKAPGHVAASSGTGRIPGSGPAPVAGAKAPEKTVDDAKVGDACF